MGVKDHSEDAARDIGAARCHILTVSDSRTAKTDESGDTAAKLLEKAGHKVVKRAIVENDLSKIVIAIKAAFYGADLVLALGGTGVSRRDVTVEAVRGVVEKELPGFGELFRALSVKEIGTAAILSRALFGTTGEKIVAVTPGSPGAVRLALQEILIPQLKHLLRELRKHS